jgi:hypothetical protein
MLNDEILETIQQIGGIFLTKNIPVVPVNIEYLEEKIAPGMETLVIKELIMHLDNLFMEYQETEMKVHKFVRYSHQFKIAIDGNSDGSILIGKMA